MLSRAWRALALGIALFGIAACSGPLRTEGEDRLRISSELGTPAMPLASGLYRVSAAWGGPEQGAIDIDEMFGQRISGTNRPAAPDLFVVQRHDPSQSYVSFLGNTRFYEFDGRAFVLEIYTTGLLDEDDVAFYLPATIEPAGQAFRIAVYGCTDIPENYRLSQGIESDCAVTDRAVLLRALGLMDFETLGYFEFERVQEIADLAR